MTPLFGPGWGNYAIQGIVETTLPEAVSLMPQTVGWLILLGFLTLFLAYKGWQRRQRWLRDRYRRDALAALQKLRQQYEGGDAQALRDLAPLLRATALAACGDRRLASVRGQAWADELRTMAPDAKPLDVATLDALAYGQSSQNPDEGLTLFAGLAEWIQRHRSDA